MPVPGAHPKPEGRRHNNRTKPTFEWREVPNVPYTGPVPVDPDPQWPLNVLAWWQVIIRMPHCVLWQESDWWYAHRTAEVWAKWEVKADPRYLTEARQRERVMGTTVDSLRDTRIRYIDPLSAAPLAPVRSIEDRNREVFGDEA